jgi:2-polyprenyl-3-methyl-5-hydroxy-6-metoxy-1,4-benzoquinol methylase
VHSSENLWGYLKRRQFVDQQIAHRHNRPRDLVSILDVGCGNGSQLAIPLANMGYRVTGVDTHAPSIESAMRAGSAAAFVHGPLSDLPRRQYDAVIVSEVLEHLEQPEQLLSQSLPFLANEGVLIVTVPNGWGEFEIDRRLYRALRLDAAFNAAYTVLRALLGRSKRVELPSSEDESDHVQRFTLGALARMFDRQELQVIATRATSVASGPLVAHTLARFPGFIRLNAALADRLPLWASSGWMFVLRRRQ